MNSLKNSIFILFLFFYSYSSYKALLNENGLTEVSATSDRFLPYCEKVVKDDDTVAYGSMILFLDEEKTVGAAAGMLTTQQACLKWKS